MAATCATCGQPFEAQRRTAKFCSSHCRVRAHRAPREPAAAPVAPAPDSPAREAVPPQPAAGVYAATEHELRAAGRLDSALGQAALILARLLDTPGTDTGSSTAALAREHRAALAAAVDGAEQELDPLDELAQRREHRRGA